MDQYIENENTSDVNFARMELPQHMHHPYLDPSFNYIQKRKRKKKDQRKREGKWKRTHHHRLNSFTYQSLFPSSVAYLDLKRMALITIWWYKAARAAPIKGPTQNIHCNQRGFSIRKLYNQLFFFLAKI